MILDAIALLLKAVVNGFLGMLPSFGIPGGLTGLASAVANGLGTLGAFGFPVGALGISIGAYLAVEVFVNLWSLIVWVYAKVPFKFT